MSETPLAIQIARILHGDSRKTYGDFRAWLPLAYQNALNHGDSELVIKQGTIALKFGVSPRTISDWCRKAYAEGLLRAREQYIRLADGTGRQIANAYVVAFTVRLRRVWRAAINKLIDSTAAFQEPRKSAVSPSTQFSAHIRTAKEEYRPAPAKPVAAPAERSTVRRWDCRRCGSPNALAAERCHSCRADRPFIAQETDTP